MRIVILLAACLLSAGCATRPSGLFEAVTTVTDVERDLSIVPKISSKRETLNVSLYFGGKGSVYSELSVTSSHDAASDDSMPAPFYVSYSERFVLLGFTRTEVRIGGNAFGRAIVLKWRGTDTLAVGNVVFRKQKESNQPPLERP